MKKRMLLLLMTGIFSCSMVLSCFGICALESTEIAAASETEDSSAPIQETESESESETESETETVSTEPAQETESGEPVAESETEALQGKDTESEIQESEEQETEYSQTEASETEAAQSETEASDLDLELNSESESETQTETPESEEPESESETSDSDRGDLDENLEDPTLHDVEGDAEVSEEIEGFTVDPSQYPAADVSENTQVIYQYLTEEIGFNHAAACGVLANIQMESGFSPLALGDSGSSYGICQWHASRFNSLIAYCNANGYDYNTLTGQLAYLKYDLNTSFTNVRNYLLSVPDTAQGAYDAAYYWCVYFEAPSQTVACAQQRGNMAATEYFGLSLGGTQAVVVEELEYIQDLEFVEDLTVEF